MQIYNHEYKVTGFTQKVVRCCGKIVPNPNKLLMCDPPKKEYRCDTCGSVKTLGYEEANGGYDVEFVRETLAENELEKGDFQQEKTRRQAND